MVWTARLQVVTQMVDRLFHYSDVIMGAMASQITSLTIVYSTVYTSAGQGKHQSSTSLAFVLPSRWPFAGNSPLTGEFPAQMVSNVENVSIWWHHHVKHKSDLWLYMYILNVSWDIAETWHFFIAYMSILVKIVHKQIFRSYIYCSYCKLCCRLDFLTYGEVFLDGVIVLGLMIFQRNDRSVQYVLWLTQSLW